jgi:hypothetical protein
MQKKAACFSLYNTLLFGLECYNASVLLERNLLFSDMSRPRPRARIVLCGALGCREVSDVEEGFYRAERSGHH